MKHVGKFRAHINSAGLLLKKLELLETDNIHVDYSEVDIGLLRPLPYYELFKHYASSRLFDFKLTDQALFQFNLVSDTDIRYCYYQAPFDVPTYKEYVASQLGDSVTLLEEAGDAFYDDYELLIDTAQLRQAVSPIRYDYSPDQYEEGVHPAAHIHVGVGNDIRLCTRRRMLPTSFVLFVLRQIYPDHWRRFLRHQNAHTLCRAVREGLEPVDDAYLQTLDHLQLVLD